MNYVCLIKSDETKEVIQVPLSCREYHANKLEYVLGRTLCGCSRKVVKSSRFLTEDEICGLTRTENKLILEFK